MHVFASESLALLREAKKLQILSYDGFIQKEKCKPCINANTFERIITILRQRRDKTALKIILMRYEPKSLAPNALMKAHTDLLTIEGIPPNPLQNMI